MEFAEDTGVGPRLQEMPLVPGVVTGTVSGARVPRQHSQKLLFHIVVGTGFRYPEFPAPELLCGPHCMVEEIVRQNLQDKLDPLVCIRLMFAAICTTVRLSSWASVNKLVRLRQGLQPSSVSPAN